MQFSVLKCWFSEGLTSVSSETFVIKGSQPCSRDHLNSNILVYLGFTVCFRHFLLKKWIFAPKIALARKADVAQAGYL